MSAVYDAARLWLGTPFHHRSATRQVGCDCFGLVYGVTREIPTISPFDWPAYDLSSASHPSEYGSFFDQHFAPADTLLDAQLVVFAMPSGRWHVGLCADGKHMIHAHRNAGVIEVALGTSWTRRVHKIYEMR